MRGARGKGGSDPRPCHQPCNPLFRFVVALDFCISTVVRAFVLDAPEGEHELLELGHIHQEDLICFGHVGEQVGMGASLVQLPNAVHSITAFTQGAVHKGEAPKLDRYVPPIGQFDIGALVISAVVVLRARYAERRAKRPFAGDALVVGGGGGGDGVVGHGVVLLSFTVISIAHGGAEVNEQTVNKL